MWKKEEQTAAALVLDNLEREFQPEPPTDGLVEFEITAREVYVITTKVRARTGHPEEAIVVYKNGQQEEWNHSRDCIVGAINEANKEIIGAGGNTQMHYECDYADAHDNLGDSKVPNIEAKEQK